jgi:hypothetical protein
MSVTTHYGRFDTIEALLAAKQGIFLDVGCSDHKTKGSVGMDKRAVAGVDIVHDIEVLPWPLPDSCVTRMLMSHIVEHLKPWLIFAILDEAWRVMRDDSQLLIAMPYANSPGFWQDPSHTHAWNHISPQYFDCTYPLWTVARPKCWHLESCIWESIGNINVIYAKRGAPHGGNCTA